MLESLTPNLPPAALVLADGRVFQGQALGAAGEHCAWLAAQTGMLGYQEALSDPSNTQRLLVMSYPHIGSYGMNAEDAESDRIWAAGLIMRELPLRHCNYRAESDLPSALQAAGCGGITGVDTRALIAHLRQHGEMAATLICAESGGSISAADIAAAQAKAQALPQRAAQDLVATVSTAQAYDWQQGVWTIENGYTAVQTAPDAPLLAVYDLGVKRSSLRALAQAGLRLKVLPAHTPWAEVAALGAQGVVFSSGPGCITTDSPLLETARAALASGLPCLGLGLGHLLLAQAAGAQVLAAKQAHHGDNHSVKDHSDGRALVLPMSYTHVLDGASLPADLIVSHSSMFDGAVLGLRWAARPALSYQGDIGGIDLIERFKQHIQAQKTTA